MEEIPTTPPSSPASPPTEHLHTNTPEGSDDGEHWWANLPDFYELQPALQLIVDFDLLEEIGSDGLPQGVDYNPCFVWFARALDNWRNYPAGRSHIVVPPDEAEGRQFHEIFNAHGRLSAPPFDHIQLD